MQLDKIVQCFQKIGDDESPLWVSVKGSQNQLEFYQALLNHMFQSNPNRYLLAGQPGELLPVEEWENEEEGGGDKKDDGEPSFEYQFKCECQLGTSELRILLHKEWSANDNKLYLDSQLFVDCYMELTQLSLTFFNTEIPCSIELNLAHQSSNLEILNGKLTIPFEAKAIEGSLYQYGESFFVTSSNINAEYFFLGPFGEHRIVTQSLKDKLANHILGLDSEPGPNMYRRPQHSVQNITNILLDKNVKIETMNALKETLIFRANFNIDGENKNVRSHVDYSQIRQIKWTGQLAIETDNYTLLKDYNGGDVDHVIVQLSDIQKNHSNHPIYIYGIDISSPSGTRLTLRFTRTTRTGTMVRADPIKDIKYISDYNDSDVKNIVQSIFSIESNVQQLASYCITNTPHNYSLLEESADLPQFPKTKIIDGVFPTCKIDYHRKKNITNLPIDNNRNTIGLPLLVEDIINNAHYLHHKGDGLQRRQQIVNKGNDLTENPIKRTEAIGQNPIMKKAISTVAPKNASAMLENYLNSPSDDFNNDWFRVKGYDFSEVKGRTQYGNKFETRKVLNQEWCHLMGYKDSNSDKDANRVGNLVSGSYSCNTEQLAIESAQRSFTFQGGYELRTTAYLFDGKIKDDTYHDKMTNHLNGLQNYYNNRYTNNSSIKFAGTKQGYVDENANYNNPVAAFFRYKVYDKNNKAKLLDHYFEAQSEFFDRNQYEILYNAVKLIFEFYQSGSTDFDSWLQLRFDDRDETGAKTKGRKKRSAFDGKDVKNNKNPTEKGVKKSSKNKKSQN